jgi:hypothetical protein
VITYSATLDVPEATATLLTDLLIAERRRRGTGIGARTRAPAERGNSLLRTTFKALRRVSLCLWRIGAITAAALVLLHHEHRRIT